MKKSIVLAALFAFVATSAFACEGSCSGTVGSANINNTVSTTASTSGAGTSYSYASGSQDAGFNAHASNSGISGSTYTSGSAQAFNTSTGSGTGTANSSGWSNASVTAHTSVGESYNNGGSLCATTQSHSSNSVDADRNQSGWNISGNNTDFVAKLTNTSVSDTKSASSYADSGYAINLTNAGVTVGHTKGKAESTVANANASVNVAGNVNAKSGSNCGSCNSNSGS